MPKPPVLKSREVVRILKHLGFIEMRQKGSHKQFRHPDGRATTLPDHGSGDVKPSMLHKIARDIGMTWQQFLAIDE